MSDSSYLMPNRDELARLRLDALGALFDPVTKSRLLSSGLTTGWKCWEVGAGHSELVQWRADQVGPTGRVVATDIDPIGLNEDHAEWVEIRRGDVARDLPPDGPFDLIHARLVLTHVVEREAALASMVAQLRPGGVIVIEDADTALQPRASLDDSASGDLANKIRVSFRTLLARRDAETSLGRLLPERLRALGLVNVAADAWFPLDDERSGRIEELTIRLLRSQLEDASLLTAEEIDRHLANLAANRVAILQPPLVGAWGTKPS